MSLIFYNLFLFLYSTGIRLASVWNKKARLWINGRKNFPVIQFHEKVIWMHCASLGEFEQGRPVLEAFRIRYPEYRVVLSFFSPSGYEIRKNYPGADQVIYLPIDNQSNAKRLITAINPTVVIWVKYEYWFFYLAELRKRKIPVILISGIFRESQPFFKWYGQIWQEMLLSFDHLFVQNEESLGLLKSIGIADNVSVAGDTRFDRVIEIANRKEAVQHIDAFVGNKKVVVAGSTWEDDEIELMHYVKSNPDKRFIIAPHEIDSVNLADVKKEFPDAILYSELKEGRSKPGNANVLIIDNIGMLSKLYQYAHVAYIGGGFNKEGIHNTLEAAVYAKPVVFGPVYEKFAEAREMVAAGGAFSINNALELEALFNTLLNDSEQLQEAGNIAGAYVYSKKGATEKILAYVTANRLLTN